MQTILSLVVATVLSSGPLAVADGESLSTQAKRAGRDVQDKACEMVNGKLECVAKKTKHKIENLNDSVKEKVEGKTE